MERTYSNDSEIELALLAAAAATVAFSRKKRKRKWVRDWIAKRSRLGAYSCLLKELTSGDRSSLRNFLRMDQPAFEHLLTLVGDSIRKQDTRMRQSIPPGERLAITLRYLAEGCSFKELMYLYRVPDNTASIIVHETCRAIYKVLQPIYLKVPQSEEDWLKVAHDFHEKWNFPNCLGAIDGKHVAIVSPGEGSMYYNYKNFNSVILMALVDANYRFLYVDVGANGRAGDAGVFGNSTLATALENNTLNFPAPKSLPGRQKPVPYVIVGDDAFPLKDYLLKPYPSRFVVNVSMTAEQQAEERRNIRIFDYRLSRCRRVVENTFGIMSNRFGIFQKSINLNPDRATDVTLAAICLHNFLCTNKDGSYLNMENKTQLQAHLIFNLLLEIRVIDPLMFQGIIVTSLKSISAKKDRYLGRTNCYFSN